MTKYIDIGNTTWFHWSQNGPEDQPPYIGDYPTDMNTQFWSYRRRGHCPEDNIWRTHETTTPFLDEGMRRRRLCTGGRGQPGEETRLLCTRPREPARHSTKNEWPAETTPIYSSSNTGERRYHHDFRGQDDQIPHGADGTAAQVSENIMCGF